METVATDPVCAANEVSGVAAHQALDIRDDAADARIAVAPRHRPAIAVPSRTWNEVIAITQEEDISESTLVPRVTAHKAIEIGDNAGDPCGAIAPGQRPAVAVPSPTLDEVI